MLTTFLKLILRYQPQKWTISGVWIITRYFGALVKGPFMVCFNSGYTKIYFIILFVTQWQGVETYALIIYNINR